MSQDVEMKAYQMVEEMLTEREIEEVAPTDCSDHPMKNDPNCDYCEFDYGLGECNCVCETTTIEEVETTTMLPCGECPPGGPDGLCCNSLL